MFGYCFEHNSIKEINPFIPYIFSIMNCKKCKKPMVKNGTTKNADGVFQKYKCKCGYTSQDQITGIDKKQVQEM